MLEVGNDWIGVWLKLEAVCIAGDNDVEVNIYMSYLSCFFIVVATE